MRIEQLSITDFRVFSGSHEFDLKTRDTYNSHSPIVLFGGLNGAGKTTILTAVRLALYGRLSLGPATSRTKYDKYLSNSIHRVRDNLLQASHAAVELTFTYSHMGTENRYKVRRAWSVSGKNVVESVDINKDDTLLTNLTAEQKQGFLNDLVPIGVSDLFFFDGEKIADLAADKSGSVLAMSIKRLLGLDLIDELNSDLGVLIRAHTREIASTDIQKKMDELNAELSLNDKRAHKAELEYEYCLPELQEAITGLEQSEREFLARGGAWAVTRGKEIEFQESLMGKKRDLEEKIRKLLSGSYPLCLAKDMATRTLDQLRAEGESANITSTRNRQVHAINEVKVRLQEVLHREQHEKMHSVIADLVEEYEEGESATLTLHDIGSRAVARIEVLVREATEYSHTQIKELSNQLAEVKLELDNVGERIERAPDERTIRSTIDSLNAQKITIAQLTAKKESYREKAKGYIRSAIDISRRLEELHFRTTENVTASRTISLAKNAQNALSEFALRAAAQRTKRLEEEFIRSFSRLARKEDIDLNAQISPETFRVTLIGSSNQEISKDDLSAGERQIYAIAMLEALAKTSGRKLPIIIDTPLGRLDSKHRDNLVNHYFPNASHQVIILSTDTEVDKSFYKNLSRHISRAYRLDYDSASGSTFAKPGYFWREKKQDEAA